VASKFDWPGAVRAVEGSAGVSETVRATAGAIGYIDFNYVIDDHLAGVTMRNADGEFVAAGVASFREAVMHSTWFASGDFSQGLADQHGKGAWPITMGTYIAVPRIATAAQLERTERALRFVVWGYLHGDALARQARFVPLPEKVQASAYREIAKVSGAAGEPIGLKLMGSALR
jgi:phosphate transport system substrate-binding protein